MPKRDIRQILADNLRRRIDASPLLGTQRALAQRAQITSSHLSEIMRCMASATVTLVADLADALGCEPWELLTDGEETRKAALARMILGDNVPIEDAPPPKKKKGGNGHRPAAK